MSPEQADGRLDLLGSASDVYSLGATLYALLTGRAPIDDADTPTVLDRVRRGDFPPPRQVAPEVPAPLDAICLKAMALKPAGRYVSPLALAADLEAYLADEPVSAHHEPLAALARRWARRHQRLVSGAAATMLMTLVTLAVVAASNLRLDAAYAQIRNRNERITDQNEQLEESNRSLELARADADRERDQATAVTDFLVSSFRSPDPALDGRTITIAEVLQRAVDELAQRDDLPPATRATILNAIGETYSGLGLLPEAVQVHEAASDIRARELGPDHLDTLSSQNNLALAYLEAGRLDEAIPLFEATLQALHTNQGIDHLDTLSSQNNLALAYLEAGRLDEAIPLFESTLQARRVQLGPDHIDTLTSQNNLAYAYLEVGRLDEAIPLFEATLQALRKEPGIDHPDTLSSQNNLALAYQNAGRLDQAIPLFEATLQARRAKQGNDHIDTLTSQNNLALAYQDAGRNEEALPLFEAAVRGARITLSELHPKMILYQNRLVQSYESANRLAESEAILRGMIAASGRGQLRNDEEYARTLAMFGSNLTRQQEYTEAASTLRECLKIQEGLHSDDWTTAHTRSLLGEALAGLDRFDEAKPLLLDAHRQLSEQVDAIPAEVRDVRLRDSVARLVRLYEAWGRPKEAARWRRELAALRAEPALPDDVFAGPDAGR
jgi:tetratricopeptide (TPR) repeat protein